MAPESTLMFTPLSGELAEAVRDWTGAARAIRSRMPFHPTMRRNDMGGTFGWPQGVCLIALIALIIFYWQYRKRQM